MLETYRVSFIVVGGTQVQKRDVRIDVPETVSLLDLDAALRAELPHGANLIGFRQVLER
jgi:hypothetical protein